MNVRIGAFTSSPLSIHINDGEVICIPFTTVRRFNHRQRWAVVSVHESRYINLFLEKKKKKCAQYHFRTYATYIRLYRKVGLLSRIKKRYLWLAEVNFRNCLSIIYMFKVRHWEMKFLQCYQNFLRNIHFSGLTFFLRCSAYQEKKQGKILIEPPSYMRLSSILNAIISKDYATAFSFFKSKN